MVANLHGHDRASQEVVHVGFESARSLHTPLDVFLVRKLGVPGHDELAMGAIASGGVRVLSHDIISQLGISMAEVDAVTERDRRRGRRPRADAYARADGHIAADGASASRDRAR